MRQGDSERRKHARRTVLLPCRVESQTTSGKLQVINLSVGGCLIAARDTVVPPGVKVTVRVTLEGIEVPLTGRVVHARDGWGFALEFADLTNDARQRLEQFLALQAAPG